MASVTIPPDRTSPTGLAPTSRGRLRDWCSAWPAAVVVLSFGPLLLVHARMLWSRPHYQIFPLVIPCAIALAWRSCRGLGQLDAGSPKASRLLAALGWVLLALGVLFISPSLGAIGALVTLLAAVYALGGRRLAHAFLPAWLFLWLIIPLPRSYDLRLVTGLQNLVSRWTSELLDTLGALHLMEGNVVEVAGRRLLVDQACSGIYSLFTLVLGALFYSMWIRSSVPRTLFLLAAAIFWVVFGNIVRIVAIVELYLKMGIDASVGLKHEALGLAIFALMLLLVASTDRFYTFLASVVQWIRGWAGLTPVEHAMVSEYNRAQARSQEQADPSTGFRATLKEFSSPQPPAAGDARDRAKPGQPERKRTPAPARAAAPRTLLPPPSTTWLGSIFAALGFGLLLLPQSLMPGVNWREVLTTADVYSAPLGRLDVNALPARWESFQRTGFRTEHREMDDSWGENSRTWSYLQGIRRASVSVDHQFVDWHDLSLCYSSQGWQVSRRRIGARGERATPADSNLVFIDFTNPIGRYGTLIYGLYGRDGQAVTPPEATSVFQTLRNRLINWYGQSGQGRNQAVARLNHQVQFFMESEAPLSDAERDQALAFFQHSRGLIQREGLGIGEVSR